MTRERAVRWVAAGAALVVFVLLLAGVHQPRPAAPGAAFSPFLALVLGGGLAWALSAVGVAPRNRRLALLMWLVAVAISVLRLVDSSLPLVFTVGMNGQWVLAPLIVLALLAYPTGRLSAMPDRVTVAAAAVAAGAHAGLGFVTEPSLIWCTGCPPGLNLLLVRPLHQFVDAVYPVLIAVYGSAFGYTSVVLVRRWATGTRLARRVRAPMLLPAIAYTGVAALFFAVEVATEVGLVVPSLPLAQLGIVSFLAQLVLPVTFLVGLARGRTRRGRVADLVTELGTAPSTDRLQDALRRTLADSSLVVGYWTGDRYTTADGAAVDLPAEGDERAATLIDTEGRPLAVLVHDAALLDEHALLDAAAAAAKLAVENGRLAAELRVQLDEVRASRARIVAAADEARRQVERDLHDGAQQRLVALSLLLRRARAEVADAAPAADVSLAEAVGELEGALIELRALARGVYPVALVEGGLAGALDGLAERAVVPTIVEHVPDERYPPAVEATAYFVACEAMTNAAKHAAASAVHVRAVRDNGHLVVEVRDDGLGTASVDARGGLQGLRDRVEALEGTLTITSEPGRGTLVRAQLPCASS
jgi:signal transduction histidine kinase